MQGEEFKIKTSVELSTDEAERKLKSFIGEGNKKVPILVDLKLGNDIKKQLNSLSKKLNESFKLDSRSIQGFDALDKSIKNIRDNLRGLDNVLKGGQLNIFNMDGIEPRMFEDNLKYIEKYARQVEQAYKRIDKAKEKQQNKPLSEKATTNQLEKLENKLSMIKYKFKNIDINFVGTENLDKIERKIEEISRKARDNAKNGLKVESPSIQMDMNVLKEQERLLRKLQNGYRQFENQKLKFNVDDSEIRKVDDAFQEMVRKVSSMKDLKIDFNVDGFLNQVKSVSKEFESGALSASGFKRISDDFKSSLSAFTIGDVLGDSVVDFSRSVGQAYIELDRSMREIKKVADPSDINSVDKLKQIRTEAIGIAKDVGMSSAEVQKSIASSLQAGIGGMKESIAVAKQSMILANVGDMSQDSASKAINTVIKSFKLKPLKEYEVSVGGVIRKTNELKNAMDMMNFAGNNYAIGTDGIAEAMKRGGAVLANYNVSLADSIGLITATNEAIQDPARVGNGLKSIAINLAGMKVNAKNGTMELNKTAKALKDIAGVDVYKDKEKGQLKNMVEILDEVQGKWSSLTDAQQKALSEAVAGKTQATVFQSLMGNYEAFNKIRKEFANGEHFGSAERENEQYVNSLDGKLNRLKETWLDTFSTIVSSDFSYGLLDTLNAISEAINGIVKSASQIKGGLGSLFGGILFGVKGFKKGANGQGGFLNAIFGSPNQDREYTTEIAENVSDMMDNIDITSNRGFLNFGKMKDSVNKFKDSWKNGDKGIKAVGRGIADIAKNSVNLDVATGAIKGLVGGIAQGAMIGFAVEGIGMAIKALDEYARRYEIADQKHTEKIENLRGEISTYREQKSALQSISSEYEKLANKTNRTAQEEQRYLDIRKQIAEIMPELVVGSDKDGNPLLALGSSLNGVIAQLDHAIAKKEKLLRSEQNAQADNALKLGDKTNGKLDGALAEFERAKEALDRNILSKKLNEKSFLPMSFEKELKQARKFYQEQDKIYTEANNKLQEHARKRAEINNKISTKIGNELSNSARYGNYKKANDDVKGSVNEVIKALDWSNVDLGSQKKITKGLDNMALNLTKNKGLSKEVKSNLEALERARINFNASGNESQYNKDLNKIATNLSKIMGIDASVLVKGLKESRSEVDAFNEGLSRFLNKNGKTFADFVSNSDKKAQELAGQFRAMNDMLMTGLESPSNLTKEYIIDVKASMPKDVQDLIGNVGESGILKDNKVTEIEKQVLLKVSAEIAENGDIDAKAKKTLQDIFNGVLKPEDIKGDLKSNGKVLIGQDMLKSLAMDIQGSMSQADKVKAQADKLKEKVKGITDSIKRFFTGNKGDKQEVNGGKVEVKPPEFKFPNLSEVWGKIKDWWSKLWGGTKDTDKTQKISSGTADVQPPKFKFPNLSDIWGKIKSWWSNLWNRVKDTDKTQKVESGSVEVKEPKVKFPSVSNLWGKIKGWFGNIFKGGSDGATHKVDAGTVEVKEPTVKFPSVNNIFSKVSNWFKGLFGGGSTSSKKEVKVADIKVKEPKVVLPKSNPMAKVKDWYNKTFTQKGGVGKSIKLPTIKIDAPKVKVPKINIDNEIKKKIGKVKNIKVDTKIDVKAKTNVSSITKVVQNIQKSLNKIKSAKANVHIKVTVGNAIAQLNKLNAQVGKYKGKTYHASFIAHTAQAYGKIGALISRCKQYGGKTYHASFIAHTKQAYEKIGALISRANSYGGRTFHASMTVTRTVVTKEKTQKASTKKRKSSGNINRTLTTNYVNKGEPMLFRESRFGHFGARTLEVDTKVKNNTRASSFDFLGRSKEDKGGYIENFKTQLDALKLPANAIKDAFSAMHEMVNKLVSDTVGKTTKLADALKAGTQVVLTSIASGVKDILDALKFDVNRYQELENTISRIAHSIDVLDKRLSNSVGSERIAFLQRQNVELKKRIKLNEELLKQKKKEKEVLKQELKKQGLKITKDDNIDGYEEKMLSLKRELEKLDKESEKISQSENKRSEAEQKKIDEKKKKIEELIKLMEYYNQLVFGDIFEIENSIIDDSNKVEENMLEQKRIEHEKWVVNLESAYKNVNKELIKLTNQLELLDVKMQHAWGKDKINLMNQQIELIKKSQSALKNNISVMQSSMDSVKNKLIEYGFKFNSNGDIENFVEQMNHLKDTSKEFETIQGVVDGYFDLYLEQIPEAERQLEEFNNQIKDIYKSQLEATKELEDKIMDIYKKQIEERKKLIDEELEKRLDALKKEQEAYKRSREEQKYTDDFNEQADKVKNIQKQIDLARKDTSLVGQKKLKDLLKQLEEEKKKLDDITQNRIDQEVDNAFKDEDDRLQQGAKDEKDRIDKEFSDEELLKKAQEAIKNGLFVGIDGEIKTLEDALMSYLDKWEDGLSATGAIIKSEWITKLETAKEVLKDYVGILDKIGIGELNKNDIYTKPNGNISSRNVDASINYNQPLVVVNGNVDDRNIEEIRRVVQDAIEENQRNILSKI